jgi:superfamily II DNA/RNA helicase
MTWEFYEQLGHRPLAYWQCAGVSSRLRFVTLLENPKIPALGDPPELIRLRRAVSQAVIYGNPGTMPGGPVSNRRAAALESVRKITCRGDLTPVAETVEEAISETLARDFGAEYVSSLRSESPIDLLGRWASARRVHAESCPLKEFDDDKPRGAGGERRIWEMFDGSPWSELRAWLSPQPPMGLLLDEPTNHKRPDFVISPPWSRPYVVEAHGHVSEHDKSKTNTLEKNRWRVIDWEVPKQALEERLGPALQDMLKKRPPAALPSETFVVDAAWVASQVECAVLWLLASGRLGGGAQRVGFRVPPAFRGVVNAAASELHVLLKCMDTIWSLEKSETLSQVVLEQIDASPSEPDTVVDIDPAGAPYLGFDRVIEDGHYFVRRAALPADLPQAPIGLAFGKIGSERPTRAPSEDELRPILRRAFRLSDFRQGQVQAIQRAVVDRDALVLFPTGYGKSLVFQLAAILLPGPALVVEPYKALIDDQERNLRDYGFGRVAALHGDKGLSPKQSERLIAAADIVYVAPERLHRPTFKEQIVRLIRKNGLGLFVVDEAHTVSQFGHSFRPAYLDIVERVEAFCELAGREMPPVLALTATAPKRVISDVQSLLRLRGSPVSMDDTASGAFGRDHHRDQVLELTLRESRTDSATLEQRIQQLITPELRGLGQGIVFCPHKKKLHRDVGDDRPPVVGASGVRALIRREIGLGEDEIGLYTGADGGGELTSQEMASFARRFSRGELEVMVATSAFGTGVNLQGVRWTIHVGMPAGLEAYYQETGRAGRDGLDATSWLLIDWDSNSDLVDPSDESSDDPLTALRVRRHGIKASGSLARQLNLLIGDRALGNATAGLSRPLTEQKKVGGRMQEVPVRHKPSFPGVEWELANVAEPIHACFKNAKPGDEITITGASWWSDWMRKCIHRLATMRVILHGFEHEDHGENYLATFRVRMSREASCLTQEALIEQAAREVRRISSSDDRYDAVRRALKARIKRLDFHQQLTECSREILAAVYRVVYETRVRSLERLVSYARESSQDERRRIIQDYFAPSDFKRELVVLCQERASIEVLQRADALRTSYETRRGAVDAAAADYPASLVPRFLLAMLLADQGLMGEAGQHLFRLVTAEETPWRVRRWGFSKVIGVADSHQSRRKLLDEFGRLLPSKLSIDQIARLSSLIDDRDGSSIMAHRLVQQFVAPDIGD